MADIRSTTGEKLPSTPHERRWRFWHFIVTSLFIVGVIGALGHYVSISRYAPANGYVTTTDYTEVRSATTGMIAEILVKNGDVVKKGDVLIRLDDDAERAAVAEAAGLVAKSEAELAHGEVLAADTVRQHENRIAAIEMEIAYSKECLETTRMLHAEGITSARQLADDTHALAKAEDQLRALKEIDLSVHIRHVEILKRDVQTKRESLARAEAALALRKIGAPMSGRVVRYTFYVGEIIRPDDVLYEIFEGEVNMLKLRIPERYAALVAAGMPVETRLATHRSSLIPTKFYGEVEYLRDIVEGDGTQNYRMAYCSFKSNGDTISPGTTADAYIKTGRSSLWKLLLQP